MNRDQAIERALKDALRANPAQLSDACPDAETVAAWAARALPRTEHESLDVHLSDCARCQALVAAFSRAEPDAVRASSLWTRWRLSWLIPAATAATAAAIWVATPRVPPAGPDPLATALQQTREQASEAAQAPSAVPADAGPPAVEARNREVAGTARRADASPPARSSDLVADAAGTAAKEAPPQARAAEGSVTTLSTPGTPAAAADGQANRALEERITIAAAAPAAAAPAESQAADGATGRREAFQETARAVTPLQIVSPDPAVWWRIVGGSRVERTTSAGATWTPAQVDSTAALTAGSSPDPQICWLVGSAGTVRLTTDGVRFRALPFPETVDLGGVRATSDRSAVVTARDGRTFRTDDQGATWSVAFR